MENIVPGAVLAQNSGIEGILRIYTRFVTFVDAMKPRLLL